MDDLTDKVAVVTGGASGIGLALGRAFATAEAKVVLADIEAPVLEEAAAGFADDAEVLTVVCDVSDPAAVDAPRDAAIERFGAVHVVCNNAGVSTGGPIWTHRPEDWDWVLGVNLLGVVNGIRSFVPGFIEAGRGSRRQHGIDRRPHLHPVHGRLQRLEARHRHRLGDVVQRPRALRGHRRRRVGAVPRLGPTRIHEADRSRPGPPGAEREGGEEMQEFVGSLIAGGLDPDDVAALVLAAIREGRFYVLTHPDWNSMITDRVAHIVDGEDPVPSSLPV